ncbi:MAG: transcriptional regulator PpsR [Rubrivivax sp.]|nr:transcriptional regulator PpsR [Rubrivivax sp.]
MPLALERVLLAATDLALSIDAHGRIVHVLARDATLAQRLKASWPGRSMSDTVTPESQGKVDMLLKPVEGSAAAPSRHVNHLLPDGTELPVQYTPTRFPSAGLGDGPALLLAGRDLRSQMEMQRRVVEVQQASERDHWRLRETQTRYLSIFQTSAEATLVAEGATLRIQEINPAAQALLDPSRARRNRLQGLPLASLFTPESSEALAEAASATLSHGRHERLQLALAEQRGTVQVNMTSYRHEDALIVLVRLMPLRAAGGAAAAAAGAAPQAAESEAGDVWARQYITQAGDALVFTDVQGRVTLANRAFVRLAQLSSERQAEGEPLDRWLGRPGVELQVLLAHLREGRSPGLMATELNGELGTQSPVEVAATALDGRGDTRLAFSIRDIGRRLAPGEEALSRVPGSVKQLSELIGRVPLKQIVSETSDLIEKLSIEAALQMTRDNRALAAQMLGLSRQSLYVKLRRFGMGGLGGEDED